MIEMTLTELAVTFVSLAILLVVFSRCGIWLTDKLRRLKWSRQNRICPVCYTTWVDEKAPQVSECPGCGRRNERGRLKSLG